MIVAEKIIAEQHQLPVFSILSQGCIEKRIDVAAGGAYCNIGPTIQAVGLADMANSLAAVKKLVYDTREITMDQLCNAVAANFENDEILRMKLRKAPKYGNDDDFADDLACKIFQFFADTVRSLKCYRGNYSDPAIQMVQANVGFGEMTWALPSGRMAAKPLADTMSAEQQTDVNGPTAAARSYGKLNFPAFTNGTLLNMWISRSELLK
jgi:formate C-acetyltransferase